MDFSYRHSRVQDEKLIVLEVEFLPHTKYGAIISREKSR